VATDIVPTPEEQESERAGTDAESPSIRGRVARLRTLGYDVWTQTIPDAITPKNRLILARGRA